MALSEGFIKKFFAGELMQNFTPILRVESELKPRIFALSDGLTSEEFAFKYVSGPYDDIKPGSRLILQKFHLSGSSKQPHRKHIGIVERCIFNPIEFVWNMMKQKVRTKAKPSTKINDIMSMGKEALKEITDLEVKNCVRHVEGVEKWFWEKEGMRENIEPFVIPIEESDSEWEEESEDDEEEQTNEEIGLYEAEEENDENADPSQSSTQTQFSPNPCPSKKQKFPF